jgi:hypothetical protein
MARARRKLLFTERKGLNCTGSPSMEARPLVVSWAPLGAWESPLAAFLLFICMDNL